MSTASPSSTALLTTSLPKHFFVETVRMEAYILSTFSVLHMYLYHRVQNSMCHMAHIKTLFRYEYLLNSTVGTVFNLIQMEIPFLLFSPRKQSSPQPCTGKEAQILYNVCNHG